MAEQNDRAWIKPLYKALAPVIREVFAMSFFVNILALGVPIFTLQVYDRVVQHAGISTLWGLAVGLVIVLLFDYVLRQARSRIMQTVALRVDVEVGRAVFDKFTSLPLNVLESRGGNYWQSLFRDVDTVRNTLSGAPAILICDLPFAIMFFGVIFVIAQPIVWVLMIIMALFLFVTWRAGAATGKATSDERGSSQDRDSLIAEMIQGRSTIKALALEGAMRPMWEERHAANIENAVTRGGRTDAFTNLGQTLTQSTSLMMTSFGALAIIGQELTMGSLIATNMLSGRLLGPLNQLVSQWRTYSGYRSAVERLGEVFAIESERQESEITLDKPKGAMECQSLTFTYAEGLPPVCDNINVKFDAGGIHALVGRNGSGKTTLLKMLQGLYRPSNGRVLIDGADISQFSRAELARWMGYVPQESTLFAGTVRDNITNRHPNASDAEIIRAARASGVHEFIIDLPDGYGSDIGEAGQRLSGGQRQRIAIARALIGEPSVLMLDEPSSSLDRHAEQELRETLREISKNHTVIIVTHSPILLAACDNLIALDKGKIALAGPAKDILPRLFGGAAPKPPEPEKPAPSSPPSSPAPDGPSSSGASLPGTKNVDAPTSTQPAQNADAEPAKKPLPRPAALGSSPPAKPAPTPTPTKPAAPKPATPKPAAPKPAPGAAGKPVPAKPAVKPALKKPGLKPAAAPAQKPAPSPNTKGGVKPVGKPARKPALQPKSAMKTSPSASDDKQEPESKVPEKIKSEPQVAPTPAEPEETKPAAPSIAPPTAGTGITESELPTPPTKEPPLQADIQADTQAFAKIEPVKRPVASSTMEGANAPAREIVDEPPAVSENDPRQATEAPKPSPPATRISQEDEDDPYADALQSLSTDREDPTRPQ